MAKKEFRYRGKSLEELQALSVNELIELLPARSRRTLKRGVPDEHKKIRKQMATGDPNLKTHCRDMIILPDMVNQTIKIHNGKEFSQVTIMPEMIGHYLGEFAMTRKNVAHSSPGVGATKSSANVSVK
jgi:small subunit ribosomal protein S19